MSESTSSFSSAASCWSALSFCRKLLFSFDSLRTCAVSAPPFANRSESLPGAGCRGWGQVVAARGEPHAAERADGCTCDAYRTAGDGASMLGVREPDGGGTLYRPGDPPAVFRDGERELGRGGGGGSIPRRSSGPPRGRPCLGRVVQSGIGRSGSSGRGRCAFSQNPMTENWGVTSSSAAEALAPPLDPSAPAHASVALHVLPLEGPC